ncbi:MAG: DMT family transporter, partial [bacterium]|nr:DMT family transporter [bacterium]
MLGIAIALGAQLFIGLSLVVDKFFLKTEKRGDVILYVFWIGMLDVAALTLAFFGLSTPPAAVILPAMGAGITLLIALYFYFLALERGEASHTLAIVGGFAPLATVLIANRFGIAPLNAAELTAFALLTLGGLVMFASERIVFSRVIFPVLLASLFFGISNTLAKLTFDQTPFITGFVLIKAAEFLSAFLILLVPAWRRIIMTTRQSTIGENKALYISNRTLSGIGALLIYYALKLQHPALVEALNGARYVIIFIAALLITTIHPAWLKERFRGWTLVGKITATALIMIGLAFLGIQGYYASQPVPAPETISWGVTYSPLMSRHLGLDWKETYNAVAFDLHPAFIRIGTYWDTSEPQPGTFNFDDVDFQIQTAERANIPIIMVVGQKAPRWPECHTPEWARVMPTSTMRENLLGFIGTTVARYKNSPSLLYWQVENEPF